MEIDEPIIDYVSIGKRIKALRLKKKLTQEKLANQIHVVPDYITKIEKGSAKPSLNVLLLIAQVLETTMDTILYDNLGVLVKQYDADAKVILDDCSPRERAYLLELLLSAKTSMRKHRPYNSNSTLHE